MLKTKQNTTTLNSVNCANMNLFEDFKLHVFSESNNELVNSGLLQLHYADDNAIIWLTNLGK